MVVVVVATAFDQRLAVGEERVELEPGDELCESLAADLTRFAPGRALDDNAHMLLRFAGGGRGMLWSSQVAPGNENGLRLRVYGDKGGLEWLQEEPNTLIFSPFGKPPQRITRGGHGALPVAAHATRIPSGHPEGYLEGFASLYSEIARAIRAARQGGKPDAAVIYPTVEDGLVGMEFVEAALESSRKGNVWVKV